MALAFKRLRPLFRERGKINAEVTGPARPKRSAASASSRPTPRRSAKSWSSRRGVHRLFRNIAQSITGVSAITAFSTVVVGVIGMMMIIVGGRAILVGHDDASASS